MRASLFRRRKSLLTTVSPWHLRSQLTHRGNPFNRISVIMRIWLKYHRVEGTWKEEKACSWKGEHSDNGTDKSWRCPQPALLLLQRISESLRMSSLTQPWKTSRSRWWWRQARKRGKESRRVKTAESRAFTDRKQEIHNEPQLFSGKPLEGPFLHGKKAQPWDLQSFHRTFFVFSSLSTSVASPSSKVTLQLGSAFRLFSPPQGPTFFSLIITFSLFSFNFCCSRLFALIIQKYSGLWNVWTRVYLYSSLPCGHSSEFPFQLQTSQKTAFLSSYLLQETVVTRTVSLLH